MNSAVYYLFIANCDVDKVNDLTFTLSGVSEWKNPYGYLNGENWGDIPVLFSSLAHFRRIGA